MGRSLMGDSCVWTLLGHVAPEEEEGRVGEEEEAGTGGLREEDVEVHPEEGGEVSVCDYSCTHIYMYVTCRSWRWAWRRYPYQSSLCRQPML